METIALADDHGIVCEGIRNLMEALPECRIVGQASDGPQAVDLVQRLKPDLLITDLIMPGLNGVEVVRQVRRIAPQTRVLIYTMYASQSYVAEAFEAGAGAYVLKNTPPEELIEAIRAVRDGRQYISACIDESNREYRSIDPDAERPAFATLTPREHEVLLPIVQGKTSGEIARDLGISQRTVEFHRANTMTKLGVQGQAELVRIALQYGILHME